MIIKMGKEYRLMNGTAYRLLCVDAGALIADLLMKDARVLEAVHRATQSVESRLNDKITKTLARGFTIKITE